MNTELMQAYSNFMDTYNKITKEQEMLQALIESNEKDLAENKKKIDKVSKDLNIEINALNLLSKVTDNSVQRYYSFTKDAVNSALARIFADAPRKIELEEGLRGNTHKQLYITIISENGIERELEETGHGVSQIVSLLTSLISIVIKGDRRLMLLDEVLYGCSLGTRHIIDKILWAFTGIGFQFILSEHSYVPAGAKVYWLENINETSNVKASFIAKGYNFLGDSSLDSKDESVDYERVLT